MPSISPNQQGGSLSKAFSRHYHRATHNPVIIDSKTRRDLELLRRRKRSRMMKWFAIGVSLFSIALAGMLFLRNLL